MNFSEYRLTDPSQINDLKAEMGDKSFFDYGISIYKYLAGLKPGQKFDICKRVDKKNVGKFVKIICLYMIDFPGFLQVNDEFTEITVLI